MGACFPSFGRIALFLALQLLGACAQDPCGQDSGQVPQDVEHDTEQETDTGTSGGENGTVLQGEVLYRSTVDGEPHCDARIALTGTAYTGECEGCEWAFSIETEITEDNGTADCMMAPQLSYRAGAYYENLAMAYVPVLETYSWWGNTYAYDVFMTGYDYVYYGTVYGPYWFQVSSSEDGLGTFDQVGNEIEWTFDLEYSASSEAYSDLCDEFTESHCTQPFGGDFLGSSDLDCDGETLDVWSFTMTDDASTLSVTVDTYAEETAFDPLIWVRSPAECSLIRADDNFECTFAPVQYRCPSLQVEGGEAGDYLVVVASYGSCTGETASYQLRIDGAVTTDPVLELDDTDRYIETLHVLDIDGWATLIE